MTELQVDYTDERGRTFYKPATLRIAGVSKYRDDQFSFEGVDGFWQMGEHAYRSVNSQLPPVGTVAVFTLRTNPKRGENARPGSLYRDIIHVAKAPEGAQPVAQAPEPPREAWNASPPATAQAAAPYEDRDTRITRAQAINNRVAVFSALVGLSDKRLKEMNITIDQLIEEHVTIQACLLAMDGGKLPDFDELWSSENPAQQDAAEIDQQANAHLGEETTEMSF